MEGLTEAEEDAILSELLLPLPDDQMDKVHSTDESPRSRVNDSASLPGTSASSDAVSQTEKVKSGSSKNAEYLRRYREKRKREMSELRQLNEELEMKREMYLARIAELQAEVDALRGTGEADLKKENELLRIEVKKARAFVQNLVRAVNTIPSITEEERARIFREGSRSASSQGLGMAHTSLAWKRLNPYVFSEDPLQQVVFRCQFLPHGVPREQFRRVNIRAEEDLPAECGLDREKLWDYHKLFFTDIDFLNAFVDETWTKDGIQRRYENFLDPEVLKRVNKLLGDEEIRVFKCIEERKESSEQSAHSMVAILFVSMSMPVLNVRSFLPHNENVPDEPCKCFMFSAFSGTSLLKDSGLLDEDLSESTEVEKDNFFQTQFLIPHNNDSGAVLLAVSSYPLNRLGAIQPEHVVDANNEVGETYKEMLRLAWQRRIQVCSRDSKS